MSYRLIDANALTGVISNDDYEKVLNAPFIFADLPNGLDGEHYNLQESCDDAISRQAVLDAIEDDNRNGHYSCFASNNDAQCFKGVIGELPPVNPQEPKTGHWILGICDNCGYNWGKDAPLASVTNFCPNCGCRMVEPRGKRCADCNHYGKLSLDCGRCDDDCSMYEPQKSEEEK